MLKILKDNIFALLVFFALLTSHFHFSTREIRTLTSDSAWANFTFDAPVDSRWTRYYESEEHWLGLSYSMAGAFAVWCFLRILRMKRKSIATNAGGLTVSGVLWASVCFLTGCCGSPMLPIYIGLFGPSFADTTKILTFFITQISLLVGFVWMTKYSSKQITQN